MTVEDGSITQWLQQLRSGESDAAREIWNRFYPRIVRFAELNLQNNADHAVDGEDVAQSAFRTVYLAVMDGKYPDIDDRRHLWRLLIVSTLNRVRRHYRDIHAQKRSIDKLASKPVSGRTMLMELSGPVAEAEMADLVETLFRHLDQEDPSGELRQIAMLQLEQHSATAIAQKMQKRKTYVLQRIRWVRILWEELIFP
jgi:hypothetical protein